MKLCDNDITCYCRLHSHSNYGRSLIWNWITGSGYILLKIYNLPFLCIYVGHKYQKMTREGITQIYVWYVYIYIYILVEKNPNSSHMYDHGFMDNTNRKFTKWLPPWRKGRISCLWIKSVFDCLTIGIIHETMVVHMTWVWTFFNKYSNHPRMCVLSTLCGNVDKHSPFDFIYIYIYMRVRMCAIVVNSM